MVVVVVRVTVGVGVEEGGVKQVTHTVGTAVGGERTDGTEAVKMVFNTLLSTRD